MLTPLFVITLFGGFAMSTSSSGWSTHGVLPDVVGEEPVEKLEVAYKDSNKKANFGNVLTPTQVRKQPEVSWPIKNGEYYTLMMIDPDAPSRENPKMGQWRHWLVGNIHGDVSAGDVLSAYVGAGPPQKTGLHRYVFLVFKQPGHIHFEETVIPATSSSGRPKFNAKKFAEKYKLGKPIAGNFFRAEYDDYVPTLYKQLKN